MSQTSRPFGSALLPVLVAGSALMALTAAAGAQIDVYRVGIPDFDQRRTNLDGNGGMHCVPTSCMNLYAYASNNGTPGATFPSPGPRNWAAASNYNNATTLINALGNLMGTTAANGTNTDGAQNGLDAYNVLFTGGRFTADVYGVSGNLGPTPTGTSFNMLLGGLVAVCYGRYEQDTAGRWSRGGGHCMTLAAVQDGDFLVRDPAADEGDVAGRLTMQSPFKSERYTMARITANFNTSNGVQQRTVYQFVEKGNGRFFDKVMVLWPQVGITVVNIGNIPHVKFVVPFALASELQEVERVVAVPGLLSIDDVAIALDKGHVYINGHTSRTSGGLYRHNRVTDEIVQVTPMTNPGKVCVDRHGKVWAADGSVIKIVSDYNRLVPAVATLVLPNSSTPDDLHFDDVRDEMHILSTSNDRLIIAIADGSVRANLRLPGGVDLQGDGSVCPSPDGLKIWLAHQGDGLIRECVPSAAAAVLNLVRTFSLPGVTSIRSMQLDDQGHLFISNGTAMHEFREDPASGRWVAVPDSAWSGRLAGASLNLGRSRTNFNPADDMPGDVNILNGEPGNGGSIADCIIDFNFDSAVNPDDLADYISGYFGPQHRRFPDRRLDVDADGSLTPDDLADYITAFFAGEC